MISRINTVLRSSYFYLLTTLLAIAYITGMVLWMYSRDIFPDKIYAVSPIDQKSKELANAVTTGIHINSFPEFSFYQNNFVMDATVWFRYPIGTESINTIEKFDFDNGTITQRSSPVIKIIDNEVLISFGITLAFKTHLDYSQYPLSDHQLTIILNNKHVTTRELVFISEDEHFELADNLLVANWLPTQKSVQSGSIKTILNKTDQTLRTAYPCVVFTIDFFKNSFRDLITLYLPLFAIFCICFFTLLIDIASDLRFNMIATSLPLLVLYRIVIDGIAPDFGRMTKIDFVFFLVTILSLVILFFQAYLIHRVKSLQRMQAKDKERCLVRLEIFNSLVFIGILLALTISLTYNMLA